jgi:predicted  nucleic acid-binding Zn-ribbon protein
MTRELSAAEKAFNKAKKEFVALSQRTAKALNRERVTLAKQLKRANARARKLREQIKVKQERLAATTHDTVSHTLDEQIANLKTHLAEAREQAKVSRAELADVRTDLASARDHLERALHIDNAMAALEKRWAKAMHKKAKKTGAKKTPSKKTSTKKTSAKKTSKTSAAKKKTSATRSARARRPSRRPTAAKKARK